MNARHGSLVATLLLALALRVFGVGTGLGYDLTYDEIHEVFRALKLGAGEYQWSFGKGGLYQILFVEYGMLFVIWWCLGVVETARDFAVQFVVDPSAFFLLGRLTVALMGAATGWIVFLVGQRVFSRQAGILAALFGATAASHVAYSRLINVDIGVTLATWVAMLVFLTYERRPSRRRLAGCGALVAVAIAFKLPGAIVLLPLGLALAIPAVAVDRRTTARRLGTLLGSTVLCLTVLAPEWVGSLGAIAGNFSKLLTPGGGDAAGLRWDIDSITIMKPRRWFDYLGLLAHPGHLAVTGFALIGAGLCFYDRRRWGVLWTVMVAVFLLVMSAADRSPHERYLFPILPALWLLAAHAIVRLSGGRPVLLGLGLSAALAVPIVQTVQQAYALTLPDTRLLAKEWIEANVPPDSRILMDGMRNRFVMSPPLVRNDAALRRLLAQLDTQSAEIQQATSGYAPGGPGWGGGSRRTWEIYVEANRLVEGPTYDLHSTVYGLAVQPLHHYVDECFDLVVTSSDVTKRFEAAEAALRFPDAVRFYASLQTDPRARRARRFQPEPGHATGPTLTLYALDTDCAEEATRPQATPSPR
jgi:4-amino-4-deoxy-L-arabinose transferase-like glycosyltransferase